MHSGASGVASPQNVRKCVFTFYGRATPVARERNPTTLNAMDMGTKPKDASNAYTTESYRSTHTGNVSPGSNPSFRAYVSSSFPSS